jgi:hypothetical protein
MREIYRIGKHRSERIGFRNKVGSQMEDTEDRNESQKKEKKLKGRLYKEGKRQRGETE